MPARSISIPIATPLNPAPITATSKRRGSAPSPPLICTGAILFGLVPINRVEGGALADALELDGATAAEADVLAAGQALDLGGHQDLAAGRLRRDPGREGDIDAEHVPALARHLSVV